VGGRDHRRWPFVHGVDDLGVIYPAEVDRSDREVGVAELTPSSGMPSRDISTA
jgi:hypothetical protein